MHVDYNVIDNADADGVLSQAGILREIEERPLVNRLLPVGKKGFKQQHLETHILYFSSKKKSSQIFGF